MVDPAGVIGGDVFPSGLDLVAHGPHEVALNVVVEDIHDTVSEAVDLVIGVEGGVNWALAILDHGLLVAETT